MTILAMVLGAFVLYLIVAYNTFVRTQNGVENAFGALDAQLKQRFDLIPNLVATVRQYAAYEQNTLTHITELRTRYQSGALGKDERLAADAELSAAFRGIFVAMENYPALQANENFMQLQRALNETEEQIAAGRRNYNGYVTRYNNAVMFFPNNIFASILGFEPKTVLATPEAERGNVNVKDLFGS
jgi:LemA protein